MVTFVVGVSSNLDQPFRPSQKWGWEESYLATTLALNEHYRPV